MPTIKGFSTTNPEKMKEAFKAGNALNAVNWKSEKNWGLVKNGKKLGGKK